MPDRRPPIDELLPPVGGESLLVSFPWRLVQHVRRAWTTSATGRLARHAAADLAGLDRGDVLRLAAVTGLIAMAVHAGLVLLAIGLAEPLRLAVPAGVFVACTVLAGAGRRIAAVVGRMR